MLLLHLLHKNSAQLTTCLKRQQAAFDHKKAAPEAYRDIPLEFGFPPVSHESEELHAVQVHTRNELQLAACLFVLVSCGGHSITLLVWLLVTC